MNVGERDGSLLSGLITSEYRRKPGFDAEHPAVKQFRRISGAAEKEVVTLNPLRRSFRAEEKGGSNPKLPKTTFPSGRITTSWYPRQNSTKASANMSMNGVEARQEQKELFVVASAFGYNVLATVRL